MVRFNDKTIISSLASDDILPMTDISSSGDDRKVTVQMLSQYTVDNISTLSGGQSLTDNNLTNTLKSNYDTSYNNMLHGIALWGSSYTYVKNALVKTQTGSELPKLWYSLIDDNIGNNPTIDDGTYWAIYNIGGADTDLSNLSTLGETHFAKTDLSNTTLSSTFKALVLEALYPVGSVVLGITSTCPASNLGGTWTLIASGKALWTGTGSNADTTIAAGLPNITGRVYRDRNSQATSYADGAFYNDNSEGDGNGTGGTSTDLVAVKMNASRLSSIYGNSSTVQPPAYVVNAWKRTA